MTDMAREASGGAAAAGTPDNAAGGMPSESDLPERQGLGADEAGGEGSLAAIAREDAEKKQPGGEDEAEDLEIGNLAASQFGNASTSPSDPMTDPTGTSGTT